MSAFSDLLVIAMEQAVAAPMCTVRLADAGARVIKIERADGDMARHYDRLIHGTSAYFAWLNRGKESIALDIKTENDRQLLETMIAKADVFIQNFAPGAAARSGLCAKQLSARYERLIAVDVCGYGSDTPYAERRAYDMLVQAEAGVCAVTGTPDDPCKVGISIVDIATGMNAHAAILEALFERQKSGKGKAIEISLYDTITDWMAVPLLQQEHSGKDIQRTGLAHASIYPYARYRCKDGDIIVAVQNNREWRSFCQYVLEKPDLADHPDYVQNPQRSTHREALGAIISDVLGALSFDEAARRLDVAMVAWSRQSSVSQVLASPLLRRVPAAVPGGAYQSIAAPLHRDQAHRVTPEVNEHGDAIRAEFAA
jgi:itaconate CoA-transferase